MASRKLFAIFMLLGKQREFLECATTYTALQAASFISKKSGLSSASLVAEEVTKDELKKLRRTQVRILWQVYEGEQPVGNPTWAVSEKQAVSNWWFGRYQPDRHEADEEQKAARKKLRALPIFGQHIYRKVQKRKKIRKIKSGKLFS